jgi:hypothetical protein
VPSFGPKYQRKIWQVSALEFEKWSYHKLKALYNVFKPIWSYENYSIKYKKVHLFCWFHYFSNSRAEICQIFRWYFGPNNDINLKLTDQFNSPWPKQNSKDLKPNFFLQSKSEKSLIVLINSISDSWQLINRYWDNIFKNIVLYLTFVHAWPNKILRI